MPALVKAVTRVADRLEALNPPEPAEDASEGAAGDDPAIRAGKLINKLRAVVRSTYADLVDTSGRQEAEAWIALVHARLNEALGLPAENAGEAVKVLAVRRGFKKAAHLAEHFFDDGLDVSTTSQRATLDSFAFYLAQHAETYAGE